MKKSKDTKQFLIRMDPKIIKRLRFYCIVKEVRTKAVIEGLLDEFLKKNGY